MGTRVLDQLHEVLDALAGLDPDTLDDATVHDLVVGLAAETTRLDAVWCQLIGVWDNRTLWADNGSKARLARDTHLRRGRADRLVTRSRTLDSMPATAQAYAAGEINGDHVDLIASCDREWRHAIFADHEATLVNICRTPTSRSLRKQSAIGSIAPTSTLPTTTATRSNIDGICQCPQAGMVKSL